jgi:hypothetical protein
MAKLDSSAHPGGPALNPQYTPNVTPSGALDGKNLAGTVVPAKSFSVVWKGQAIPFYKGMPRVIAPDLLAYLLAEGGSTKAHATGTVGGTFATNDTLTTTIAGHAVVYTVLAGDTTDALIAQHVAAAINANTSVNTLVVATYSGAVVTVTAIADGVAGNSIAFACTKASAAGTYTASGANLAGGVNGSYII